MSLLNTNSKQRSRDSPPKDADPSACFASFCKHWQQTYDIILETLVSRINEVIPLDFANNVFYSL